MDYIFLPIIFLIGLITTLEDWRIGKIRNIWVALGFVFGTTSWLIFFILSPIANSVYLARLIANFFCASAVAFFMWKFKAWSAGDAKMLMLYVFLTPLSFYSKSYLAIFPSFVIIFNTFLILLLYLLVRSSFFGLKLTWQRKINFNWRSYWEAAHGYVRGLIRFLPSFLLFMIVVSWSYKYAQNFISLNFLLYQIVAFTLIVLFRGFFIKLFQKPYVNFGAFVLFLILFIFGLVVDYDYIFSAMSNVFIMIFLFMILFPFLNRIINFHLDNTNKKEININNLETGMIVASESITLLGFEKNLGQKFGLNPNDTEAVKRQAQARRMNSIFITQPFYFAVWLFVGVIATILVRGSLLSWMLNFS